MTQSLPPAAPLDEALLLRAVTALELAHFRARDKGLSADYERWLQQLRPLRNRIAHGLAVDEAALDPRIRDFLAQMAASSLGSEAADHVARTSGPDLLAQVAARTRDSPRDRGRSEHPRPPGVERVGGDDEAQRLMDAWLGELGRSATLSAQDASHDVLRQEPANTPQAQASEAMLARGLRPLVAFPGESKSWLCECLLCGRVSAPVFASSGSWRVRCPFCRQRTAMDPLEALKTMRAQGLEPLVPYRGARVPWPCLCDRCGATTEPTLVNVRYHGQGGCGVCASAGFDPTKPARLYVAEHSAQAAVKIGVTATSARQDRLADLDRLGWRLTHVRRFTRGERAYRVERAVLGHLRDKEGLSHFLTAAQMPSGGWTETFDIRLVAGSRLWALTEAMVGKVGR